SELGYPPLTEPLVDVQPTLERLSSMGLLSETEHRQFWERACRLHFKDRTDEALFAGERSAALADYRTYRVNRKAEDALLLVAELRQSPTTRAQGWTRPPSASLFDAQILPALAESLG